MPAYEADLDKFAGYDAQVVGISVDNIPCHIAWQKSLGGLSYPLCSDFYPHGAVAEQWGVLRKGDPIPGVTERAIFIVDKNGKVVYKDIHDISKQPPNEALFEVLRKL